MAQSKNSISSIKLAFSLTSEFAWESCAQKSNPVDGWIMKYHHEKLAAAGSTTSSACLQNLLERVLKIDGWASPHVIWRQVIFLCPLSWHWSKETCSSHENHNVGKTSIQSIGKERISKQGMNNERWVVVVFNKNCHASPFHQEEYNENWSLSSVPDEWHWKQITQSQKESWEWGIT